MASIYPSKTASNGASSVAPYLQSADDAVSFHFVFLYKKYWPPEASMLLQTRWHSIRVNALLCVNATISNSIRAPLYPSMQSITVHHCAHSSSSSSWQLAKSLVTPEAETAGIESLQLSRRIVCNRDLRAQVKMQQFLGSDELLTYLVSLQQLSGCPPKRITYREKQRSSMEYLHLTKADNAEYSADIGITTDTTSNLSCTCIVLALMAGCRDSATSQQSATDATTVVSAAFQSAVLLSMTI